MNKINYILQITDCRLKKFGIWNLLFTIFLLQFIICNCLYAKQSGAGLLEIPPSVRAGGMAESFTALSDEPFGVYYNPAGISFMDKGAISFAHHSYIQDFNSESMGIVFAPDFGAIAITPSYIYMKSEPIYDSFGDSTGKSFRYSGFILPLTISAGVNNFSFGTTLKYYSESIDDYSVSYLPIDLGMMFRLGILRLGISSLNLKNLKGGETDVQMPRTLKTGVALVYKGFTLSCESDRQLVRKESGFSVGGEIQLAKIISLRSGYKSDQDFGGMAAGLGIKLGDSNIDYAFLNYGDLGNTHRIGVSFGIGPSKGEFAERREVPQRRVEEPRKTEPEVKPVPPPEVEIPPVITKPAVERSTVQINIAVADFAGKNVSAMDGSIVADFLRTELVNIGVYKVIDKANMDKILAEAAFQQTGCTAAECAVQIGKILNVRQMIVGSLSKLIDTYYITVNLVDVETGEIKVSYKESASSSRELETACKTLAQKLSE